jgi:hypothetical protein
MSLATHKLPEDDPLVSMVLVMDRDLARGGSGAFPKTDAANHLALSAMPIRLLSARDLLAALGRDPIGQDAVHDLVRLARGYAHQATLHHITGIPRLTPEDQRSGATLKAVVPSLLATEAALSDLDGEPAPPVGILDAIAAEIEQVGRVYPLPDRHYRAVGELVRRVRAAEARASALSKAKSKVPAS